MYQLNDSQRVVINELHQGILNESLMILPAKDKDGKVVALLCTDSEEEIIPVALIFDAAHNFDDYEVESVDSEMVFDKDENEMEITHSEPARPGFLNNLRVGLTKRYGRL